MTKMISLSLLLTCFMICAGFAPIKTYNIGDVVDDFSLKNVNNTKVSMNSYPDAKGFIIVFTCNHCPFAKKYEDRLKGFQKKYGKKGFQLIAISSNDAIAVPEDNFEAMRERAKNKKYNFPYLYDSTQEIAKAFHAVKTPHAFIVANENGKYILKYSGGIDDNAAEPDKAEHHYVDETVTALLEGKPLTVTKTNSVGCSIKWFK